MNEHAPATAFESCPAATGVAGCLDFPDGAHRCGKPRPHVVENTVHACTCGSGWTSELTTRAAAPSRRTPPSGLSQRREGNTL